MPDACVLPPEVVKRLAAFLDEAKTGEFVLDVKDGRVLGWRVLESGRVARQAPKYAMQ